MPNEREIEEIEKICKKEGVLYEEIMQKNQKREIVEVRAKVALHFRKK